MFDAILGHIGFFNCPIAHDIAEQIHVTVFFHKPLGPDYRRGQGLGHGPDLFQVVSIGTTTGFTTAEYFIWPGFLPVMLLFASF